MSKTSIYLIHGEESFYIDAAVKSLRANYPEHTPSFFEEQVNLDEVFQVCSSASLFSQQAILLIKMPHFLIKSASDPDLKTLKTCLGLVQENGHILVCYCPGKKVDMRKKASALFKKQGTVTEHKALNDWEQDKLFTFMKDVLKKENKQIDFDAMTALEACAGNSLSILSQCLQTLSTYVGEKSTISLQDIETLYTSQQATLFQLGSALKKADTKALTRHIKALMLNHEPPVRILATLHSQIKLFYQLRLLQKQGKSEADMASVLRKHPFYIKTVLKELHSQLSVDRLRHCIQDLAKADFDLKSGRKSPENALGVCVVALTQTLTHQ